jgi:hypothetical protein
LHNSAKSSSNMPGKIRHGSACKLPDVTGQHVCFLLEIQKCEDIKLCPLKSGLEGGGGCFVRKLSSLVRPCMAHTSDFVSHNVFCLLKKLILKHFVPFSSCFRRVSFSR